MGHIFWGLNWKSLEVISDLNYAIIISSSLIVLIVILSSLLQNIALGFLKLGQLERSSLINSSVGDCDFYLFEDLQWISLLEQL